ncbi:lipopolysaccharide biosynthesis protein [Segatella copri]|uniref:lipopolysaccharide biosynthesis protein n=1 Tax=Segatella copri TaxID=165179 RepID=UPI003F9BBD6F
MSNQTSDNNKRIAKNTLFLYLRMFVMMLTALFTSRIVLDVLGAADYGLNNIIGGVVVLFSFLNSALLSATQRFLNFHLGRQDYKQTNVVFCMSMNTYLLLSIVVVVLGETIGLWFVNTHLNIPSERMYAAQWVYQFTLIQFVINLLRVPYNASIIAYEKMNLYAYVSLVEVIAKLLVVYLLYITTFDKLIFYSFLYTIVPLIVAFIYKIYCNRNFDTTKYKRIWDRIAFKEMFSFSGWSLFGSLANLAAQQGLNILINIFYGVTVNAAAGIANQVSTNVYGFISNFQTAFQPQIVKTYAAKEVERFHKLIFQTSKFSYFMVLVLVLPILFTIDGILDIWLKEVPRYTAIFCRLILVFLSIEAITAPLWMSVQATGKIRNYQILVASLIFLNFPLAYIVLKLGMPVYSVWVIRIIVNIVVMIARCIYMKKNLNFPLLSYLKAVIAPILSVTFVAIPIPLILNYMIHGFWQNMIIVGIATFALTILDVYFVGMNTHEKLLARNMILKKIPFFKCKV